MNVLLGDEVTVQREIGDDITFVTGRVSGIVLDNNGGLRYFYIKGVDAAFWMNEGWRFQEEFEESDEDA